MGVLFLRIIVFSGIWLLFFLENFTNNTLPLLLLLAAGSMSFFFLMTPMNYHPGILYFQLIVIWSISFLSNDGDFYLLLLILFVSVDASIHVKQQYYRLLVLISVMLSGIIYVQMSAFFLPQIMLLTGCYFIAIWLNKVHVDKEELKGMYEQLLAEYRQVKRLSFETEKAARLEERTRIARDLHDSVGHKLTSLLMHLRILSLSNEDQDYPTLIALAEDSLEETRQAVKALKTEEHEGLSSVLQLIRKLESESHIFIDFTMKQGVLTAQLTGKRNVVLYRVLQEALTNAMKHAGSRKVKVILGRNAVGDIEFTVKNKMHHFKKIQFGFGLTNMQERVKEIGGQLRVYQTETEFIISGSFPEKEREKC